MTITHVRRWLEYRHLVGTGHVYQGRFKSFPVEADEHLSALLRYVERNPLLSPPPIDLPADWAKHMSPWSF